MVPPLKVHSAPGPKPPLTAILWAHGGCFTDGNETWDDKLLTYLAQTVGADVYGCGFRQGPHHPWPAGLDDLALAYTTLQKKYVRVYVGGTSSGGFFAYALACRVRAPKCALLCPVLEPAGRASMGSKAKAEMQLAYFGSVENMKAITEKHLENPPSPAMNVLAIRGLSDSDAPAHVSCPPWLTNYTEIAVEGGTHRLCVEPSVAVKSELVSYFQHE